MFRLFRRRRDKPAVMYGVFQKMGMAIEKRQRQLSDYLNTKAERLSTKELLSGLIAFCLLFGGVVSFVIWQALHQPAATVRMQPIVVPRHKSPTADNTGAFGLTKEEMGSILAFQRYLDSLPTTPIGKATYDSIQAYRAGLLDSLNLIRKMYPESLKQSEYEN